MHFEILDETHGVNDLGDQPPEIRRLLLLWLGLLAVFEDEVEVVLGICVLLDEEELADVFVCLG